MSIGKYVIRWRAMLTTLDMFAALSAFGFLCSSITIGFLYKPLPRVKAVDMAILYSGKPIRRYAYVMPHIYVVGR